MTLILALILIFAIELTGTILTGFSYASEEIALASGLFSIILFLFSAFNLVANYHLLYYNSHPCTSTDSGVRVKGTVFYSINLVELFLRIMAIILSWEYAMAHTKS